MICLICIAIYLLLTVSCHKLFKMPYEAAFIFAIPAHVYAVYCFVLVSPEIMGVFGKRLSYWWKYTVCRKQKPLRDIQFYKHEYDHTRTIN